MDVRMTDGEQDLRGGRDGSAETPGRPDRGRVEGRVGGRWHGKGLEELGSQGPFREQRAGRGTGENSGEQG